MTLRRSRWSVTQKPQFQKFFYDTLPRDVRGGHVFRVVKHRFDFLGFTKQTQPTNCEFFAISRRNI